MKSPKAKRHAPSRRRNKGVVATSKKVLRENEEKTAKYYDERSQEEVEEEIAWGKIAMAAFASMGMSHEKASTSVPSTSKPRRRAHPEGKSKRS
jgi:hypothetical protein